MYSIVVVGNLARLISARGAADGPFVGPAVVAASTVARLGVYEMALLGGTTQEWKPDAVSDFDQCSISEFVSITRPEHLTTEIVNVRGETLRLGVITDRINIREFPDEFLGSRLILLSPFAEEVDDELIEWMSTSGDATIVLDPSLYRVVKRRVIRVPMDPIDAKHILRHVDIVLLNESEAEFMVGDSDPMVAAELLVEWGAGTSIVTRGEQGSVMYGGEDFVMIPSFNSGAPPRCWTGSSFAAAFSTALTAGSRMEEAIAYGSSVASVYVEEKDHSSPMDLREIERRWEHIRGMIEYC